MSVLVFGIYVAAFHRKALPVFLMGMLAVAIPWCSSNMGIYGKLVPPYYSSNAFATRDFTSLGTWTNWGEAIFGQWLSPSRGLLVFSPFFVVSVLCFHRGRSSLWSRVDMFVLATCALHTLGVSLFPCWWGGHSYGPRFMTDLLPYIALVFAGAMERLALGGEKRHATGIAVVVTLMLFAFCVHWAGANEAKVWAWNDLPTNVDFDVGRLWSWRDPQVLSYWLR